MDIILGFFSSIIQIINNLLNINKNINDTKNIKGGVIVIVSVVVLLMVVLLGQWKPSQSDDFNENPFPPKDPIFSCKQYTNSDSVEDSLIHYRTGMTNISEPYKVTVHPYLNIVHLDNPSTQLIFLNNVFTQATYLSANGECDLIATIDVQEIRAQLVESLNDNTLQIDADIILEISISQNNKIYTQYMKYNGGQPVFCSDENFSDIFTTIDAMFFAQRKHTIIAEITDLIYSFTRKDG